MVEWTRPLPIKKFCPQNDKFGCFLTQFLTGRKHGQSLEALGHADFMVQSRNEAYKKQCKNIQNSQSDQGGGGRTIAPPPEYATGH